MENATGYIEGKDLSPLVKAMEDRIGKLGGFTEYSYERSVVFIREKLNIIGMMYLVDIIILFVLSQDKCKVEIVTAGGPGYNSEMWENNSAVRLIKGICDSNNWQFSVQREEDPLPEDITSKVKT
jgi:hypothetical protein